MSDLFFVALPFFVGWAAYKFGLNAGIEAQKVINQDKIRELISDHRIEINQKEREKQEFYRMALEDSIEAIQSMGRIYVEETQMTAEKIAIGRAIESIRQLTYKQK